MSSASLTASERSALRRGWYGSRSGEFQREPTEDCQVGMETDALDAADAEHRQRIVVLQPSELALDGGAAPVEAPVGRGRAVIWAGIAIGFVAGVLSVAQSLWRRAV
jgi:hypothetical protein